MVSVIKRPTLDVEDVVKIPITQEKNTAQHVDLVDQLRSEVTAGRIKKLQDTG